MDTRDRVRRSAEADADDDLAALARADETRKGLGGTCLYALDCTLRSAMGVDDRLCRDWGRASHGFRAVVREDFRTGLYFLLYDER